VRVTTRDSVQHVLKEAAFHHDTLVARSLATASVIRIPGSEIAHVEARVPSLSGSLGLAAVVLGAFVTFVYLVGHAASS
jgi:hypothetical protein